MDLDSIRRDFAPFTDPATPLEVDERGASWLQGRENREVRFRRDAVSNFPVIKAWNGREFTYRDFFASELMADLRALAENQLASFQPPPAYVPSRIAPEVESAEASQITSLDSLTTEKLPFLRTLVIFLKGPAGSGKTAFLKHATHARASALLEGRAESLYLYIDAQARALSRLDDAVAGTLQDLRARFTYHALATLTRLGLLVPVIDGFDELLGVGGYNEAFGSLAHFLARLEGEGAIVASARATFYDYNNVQKSMARHAGGEHAGYELVAVDMVPWGSRELAEYLEKRSLTEKLASTTAEEAAKVLRTRLGSGADVLGSPFFVSTIADVIGEGGALPGPGRMTEDLASQLIQREVHKLSDRYGQPILSAEQHHRLMLALAEEMWWSETRELDDATLRVIAELFAEQNELTPEHAGVVLDRIPFHALLTNQSHSRRLSFQHEFFYALFLGEFIAGHVHPGDRFADVLSRATMSPVVGEYAAKAICKTGAAERAIGVLATARLPTLRRDLGAANVGTLVAHIVREAGSKLSRKEVRGAVFERADFTGTAVNGWTFGNCSFLDCDFRGALWEDVDFDASRLSLPIVDAHTRFTRSKLDAKTNVVGVVWHGATGLGEPTYEPGRVGEILGGAGVELEAPSKVIYSDRAQSIVQLLTRFLRLVSRAPRFSDGDLQIKGISASGHWDTLRDLLNANGLLETHCVARRGTMGQLMSLAVLPRELARGEASATGDSRVDQFWQALRRL